MQPYSLPNLTPVTSSNTLNWQIQPYQFNSSGTLPGTTVMNVGQNMQINGNTGQIGVGGTGSSSNTIVIDGKKDYILVSDPGTGIAQLVMGELPDGTYGMVVSKTGVSVLSLFS